MTRNPIFESSIRRRMRSYRSPLLITLYGLFLLLVSIGSLVVLQRSQITLGNLRSGLETYVYISVMQFLLIILVAPALTSGAIAGERERQTLDLLLCTKVGSMNIVLGKLFSSLCYLALIIVSSLPVMAVTLFFGGVSIWDMLLMLLFLIVTALACCSIGILCSAVFKRTVTATVVSYLTVFALGVGTVLFPLIFQYGQLSMVGNAISSSGVVVTQVSGASASSVVSNSPTFFASLKGIPVLLFINPAVGLMSMLVQQTGLLQSTFQNYGSYSYGTQMFGLLKAAGNFVYMNIAVLLVSSSLLTFLSALFIKPMGRKAKKQKS